MIVSEKLAVSIFRLNVEAVCSTETWVNIYQTTWCHNPGDHNMNLPWHSLVKQYYQCTSSTYDLLCSLHKLPGEKYSWLRQVSTFSVLGSTSSSAQGRGRHGTILTMTSHSQTATASVTLRRMVWCCRPLTTDPGAVVAGRCVTLRCVKCLHLWHSSQLEDASWRLLVTCFKTVNGFKESV
jgi:hypothetical protein